MRLEQRKKAIERLRKTGWTYKRIGSKYKISAERVRQILNFRIEVCEKHNRQYIGKCTYCEVEDNYVDKVEHIIKDGLLDEIFELAKHDRRRETVIKRIALVRVLRDKYKLPFNRIARLLKRDFTTIKSLYNNKII